MARDQPNGQGAVSLRMQDKGLRVLGTTNGLPVRRVLSLRAARRPRQITTSTMRTTTAKIRLFRMFFTGLPNVYGTYDLVTGRARQVKRPVTDRVILAHLQGKQPYGVYLLDGDRARAVVADFDVDDLGVAREFVAGAANYGLATYIERSKSKGHHVWMFLDEAGVLAAKARAVVRHILEEAGHPSTEVFPKHDRLDSRAKYGNYIYAPLFGALVPKGRTVFLDPHRGLTPAADQWAFLERAVRVTEEQLDDIIEINELDQPRSRLQEPLPRTSGETHLALGLPPCAQRMLYEGVSDYQRVSCFRLAVQLKKAGLPEDIAIAALRAWAAKNRPAEKKRVITKEEIDAQVKGAYSRDYRGCGCGDPKVAAYCDPDCPLRRAERKSIPQDNQSREGRQKNG